MKTSRCTFLALFVVAGALAALPSAGADVAPKLTPVAPVKPGAGQLIPRGTAPTAPCTAADKLRVEAFTLAPGSSTTAHPQAGRVVQIAAGVRNLCTVALTNVPWEVRRVVPFPAPGAPGFEEVVATGTFATMAPGDEAVMHTTWTALAASQNFVFTVDPQNAQQETERGNNRQIIGSYVVDAVPNWVTWGNAAKDAAQKGGTAWLKNVAVHGSTSGPSVQFPRGGTLASTAGRPFDSGVMSASGATPEIVAAFDQTTTDAWATWMSGYKGPDDPLAFPMFAGPVPGPIAVAPWASIALPKISRGNSTTDASMSATNVGATLRAKLGPMLMAQTGADAAVNDFATWLDGHFTTWKANAMMGIQAKGKAVGWTPNTPMGIVQKGEVEGGIGPREL